MEILAIIGIVVVAVLALLAFSLLGWVLKLFGYVWDFLSEGCFTSFGCIFWAIFILLLLLALIA